MNKYIDAEKLKAELERQKHELKLSIQSQGDYGQSCYIVAYDNILSLITSLQQEQPEADLDKEIEKQIRSIFFDLDGIAIIGTSEYASVEDMEYIARHFYYLGLNARKEETK